MRIFAIEHTLWRWWWLFGQKRLDIYVCVVCTKLYEKKGGSEKIISKICCLDENERFYTLLSQKHYDKEYILLPELFGAFSDIYDEKVRLELIGVELDNLLNTDKSNPALRTPEEIEKIIANERLEWQRKVDALETSEAYQNADESQRIIMLRSLIKEDMESSKGE